MVTEAPDPRTFQSWEDAFQYPIPVVRKLEQQLRNNADNNREKLRSLVGTSYRNLLSTAETIIDMEVRMQQVEGKLARVGQSCNSHGLEKIALNTVKMDTQIRDRDVERYTFASQLAVLRNAPTVMTRLMKRDGSYLLIAKVLVISRLLHKALSQNKDKPPIVDQLWERLLSVRRKLLRRIDNRLASTTGETASLVESMSAYALATSSTPTDVLQHFHKIRMEKMLRELKWDDDELAKHGTGALKLCIQTCLDTQTIFPRRLAEALSKLKAQPLIQDADVRGLFELNLEVHDRWLGDEAKNYTPWPRHDELQRPEAEKILHCWSKDAIAAFLKGVKTALQGEQRLNEVANLRQELVETWILSGSRMAGVKSANVLDDLRDTMNEKLESLVRSQTQGLQDVVAELDSQLSALPTENLGARSQTTNSVSESLWSTTTNGSDLSNGAQKFKSTILNTYQGRDQPVVSVTTAFDKWMDSVLEVKNIVKSMKEARWDDTFADDVDDESDDDLGDSKQTLLSDDDPRLLEETTQEALNDALQHLGQSMSKIADRQKSMKDERHTQHTVFLVRVIREIGDRIPRLKLQERATTLPSPFGSQTLDSLYHELAADLHHQMGLLDETMRSSGKPTTTLSIRTSNTHILWEGNPPLPSQPSPSTFRWLRQLHKYMAALGSDLWVPAIVNVLRTQMRPKFEQDLQGRVRVIKALTSPQQTDAEKDEEEGKDENKGNDGKPQNAEETDVSEQQEQLLTQALFDMLYIQRFLGVSDGDNSSTEIVPVEHLDDAARARLQKNAIEYAKKTYLLFSLLS